MPGENTLRVLVTGQQGMGKTAWARELVRRTQRAGRRLVILSTKPEDYVDLAGSRRTLHCQEPASGYSVGQLRQAIGRKGSTTFFVFERFTQRDSRAQFMGQVAAAVESVGNMVLLVDEAHQFMPRYRTAPAAVGMLTAARARAVDVVLVTQHPKLLDDLAAKESNAFVLFGSPDRNEAGYLAELSGMPQEAIQRLHEGEYLLRYRHMGGSGKVQRIDLQAEYGQSNESRNVMAGSPAF